MDELQRALIQFNIGIPNWYNWKKVDAQGNKIPPEQRMTYENIILQDQSAVMPSKAEVDAKILENTWLRQRKESYPPATDYLDGIVKGDQGQIDKYIADCLAVKEKFPK